MTIDFSNPAQIVVVLTVFITWTTLALYGGFEMHPMAKDNGGWCAVFTCVPLIIAVCFLISTLVTLVAQNI